MKYMNTLRSNQILVENSNTHSHTIQVQIQLQKYLISIFIWHSCFANSLLVSFTNITPVCDIVDWLDVVRAHVFILKIVSMFPDINAKQWYQTYQTKRNSKILISRILHCDNYWVVYQNLKECESTAMHVRPYLLRDNSGFVFESIEVTGFICLQIQWFSMHVHLYSKSVTEIFHIFVAKDWCVLNPQHPAPKVISVQVYVPQVIFRGAG